MAEIRSTLDMVLERAERLCAEADAAADTPDFQKDGMRAGARILQQPGADIAAEIEAVPDGHRAEFLDGILATLLRNIALPKDRDPSWKPALDALSSLAAVVTGDAGRITALAAEIDNILSRYHDHRDQVTSQLEEAFRSQAAQLQQSLAQQTGMQMDISPSQHPKFNEELQKHFDQLNDQYYNALEQYKQAIRQHFGL